MDAINSVRNFGASNRSTIVNVVYIVAILVILYFLVQFYLTGTSMDKMLLENKLSATTPAGDAQSNYMLKIADNTTSTDLRIKNGGEYTLSYWMYIQNWQATGSKNIDVLAVVDDSLSKNPTKPEYVLSCSLYANEPKMRVRAGGVGLEGATVSDFGTTSTPNMNMPMCDVTDIDMQRWIHVTISMNGRIMDVYLDGKLSRSCILPTEQKGISSNGTQTVILAPMGGFKGYFSGVQFSAYAVTPDQIYARYLAGPYSSRGFLEYLKEKIGISISYKYAGQSS